MLHVILATILLVQYPYCTPLYKEFLQHHGHKDDIGETFGTYSIIGKKAQVSLV